jgi:hypothetical protein
VLVGKEDSVGSSMVLSVGGSVVGEPFEQSGERAVGPGCRQRDRGCAGVDGQARQIGVKHALRQEFWTLVWRCTGTSLALGQQTGSILELVWHIGMVAGCGRWSQKGCAGPVCRQALPRLWKGGRMIVQSSKGCHQLRGLGKGSQRAGFS